MNQRLRKLMDEVGLLGVNRVRNYLHRESISSVEPWKKTLLALLADAMDQHGQAGIDLVKVEIENLLSKKKADIRKLTRNLILASDVLAHMQNAEADRREAVRAWFANVGKGLLQVLIAVGKTLV